MNSIINYIVQSGGCFIIFYLIYFFILKKETCFNYSRAYLFTSSILALLLPLVNFYSLINYELMAEATSIQIIQLPEITILSEKPSPVDKAFQLNITNALIAVYFLGLTFFLLRFLIQLFAIKKIIASNRYNIKYWQGCNLIHTHGKLPTFSFFNYLFWDNSLSLSDREQDQILKHELVHIRQFHSFDVCYFQLISIIFWFNPIILWYKNAATDVHEYIADREASSKTDTIQYSKLLVQQLFKSMDLSLGSYFNKSQTMRRLEMLKARNKRYSLPKVLLTIPALLFITLIMGFSIQKNPAYQTISTLGIDYPNISNKDPNFRNLLDPNADENVFKAYRDSKGIQKLKEGATNHTTAPNNTTIDPELNIEIESVDDQLHSQDNNQSEQLATADPEDLNEVFTIVEEQPTPIGGMSTFYKAISKELKYPKAARKEQIEGKVFVQFVVTKSGNLSDITIIKGIGFGCDKEASRVVQLAPKWNPGLQRGKAVNVKMVIPITFKLK